MPENEPPRRRGSTLWVLAVAVVVFDAAVWLVGTRLGLVGMVVAVVVIISTQRRVDAYWRAHHARPSGSTS